MTHEQIESAIERLRAIQLPCDIHEIFVAFNVGAGKCFRDVLVELLEQADPDTHIELPKDADGEVIHVGDKLDGYGKTIEVVELRIGRSGWVIVSRDGNAYADTYAFTHYHKPTVEDVLHACCSEYHDAMLMGTCDIPCDVPSLSEVISKYAEKLREVIADE